MYTKISVDRSRVIAWFGFLFFATVYCNPTSASDEQSGAKPRIIATTDGEVDDRSSMVRFLLSACDFDVDGIIQVNSKYQKRGHSGEKWIEEQLDAYERILPNLRKHHPDYPDTEQLRKVMRVGNENIDDLWTAPPEMTTKDTDGAQLIIDVLLDDDPRPVHVLSWGGANTTASALWKLQTEYPKDKYEYAVDRIRIYCIWYQDGGGKWIQENVPGALINEAFQWDNVWDYESIENSPRKKKGCANPPDIQKYMDYDWITNNVKQNHGPLGALYPQIYVSEGDTPSFLHMIDNGLASHTDYTLGGWGGRSIFADSKYPKYLTDKELVDDGDAHKMYWRWIPASQNDFAAKLDWCVREYADANHHPQVTVTGDLVRKVRPGETVHLTATASDPDGNELSYKWWQYDDADSAESKIELRNGDSLDKANFTVPSEPGKQIQLILEVTDNGNPVLTRYQRIVCKITE